jgi:hypothetical protein
MRLERNPVELGQRPQLAVVAQNQRDIDAQLPCTLPVEEVVEAVAGLGDENESAKRSTDDIQLPGHAVTFGDRRDGPLESVAVDG